MPTRLRGPAGEAVLRLALDTGATGSLVNRNVIESVGYDLTGVSDRVRITTGSGVEFVPRLRVEMLGALGQERRDFPIVCHTLPPTPR